MVRQLGPMKERQSRSRIRRKEPYWDRNLDCELELTKELDWVWWLEQWKEPKWRPQARYWGRQRVREWAPRWERQWALETVWQMAR